MNGNESGNREHWSGNLGFILAAAGSAIGLGNIWKFPYIAGENGGGAFVLVYLLCIIVIGLPVMLCAVAMGRRTQKSPIGAFNELKPSNSTLSHIIGAAIVISGLALLVFKCWGTGILSVLLGVLVFKYSWSLVGAMGVVAGFMILSFYSVVAGWVFGYLCKAFSGDLAFSGIESAANAFGAFADGAVVEGAEQKLFPWPALGCHAVFMICCISIVVMGVKRGIERWSKILMPMLFLLLLAVIIRGLSLKGATAGVSYFLNPDFSKLSGASVLSALGHAFFSLSLGMGVMITYGSYMSKKDNLFLSSLSVVGLDTLVALMAGLAIFPAVFALGFEPSAGPGLLFNVIPMVFSKMPGGHFWLVIFFLLVFIAALTSGISLLEVVSAAFIDKFNMKRWKTVLGVGIVIFLLGAFVAVSTSNWDRLWVLRDALSKAFTLSEEDSSFGSFFNFLDNIASNWLLPLGGLLISVFVGWVWGTKHAVDEIRDGSENFADVHLVSLLSGLKDDPSHNSPIHVLTLASLWGIFIRFISPIAIIVAFMHTMGWIKL